MIIAVLGAKGSLGKFISGYLTKHGHTVHPISRENLDLTDFVSVAMWLENLKPDTIINCATANNIGADDKIYEDTVNNLSIFLNFYNNTQHFKQFINIGSGAEFDRSKNINQAREDDIMLAYPKDSYGFSKNVISRLSLKDEKFYTLRLFGCFHAAEPKFRLFNKVVSGEQVKIVDRQFDYFSAQDLCTVIDCCLHEKLNYRDINCVYEEKLFLSEILNKIRAVEVVGKNEFNYTGDGKRLADLKLNLLGLDKSIEEYK